MFEWKEGGKEGNVESIGALKADDYLCAMRDVGVMLNVATLTWSSVGVKPKCGGEAQHLEKWGFGVLRDSRMFRAR
jgi:hypothetical protein